MKKVLTLLLALIMVIGVVACAPQEKKEEAPAKEAAKEEKKDDAEKTEAPSEEKKEEAPAEESKEEKKDAATWLNLASLSRSPAPAPPAAN